MSFQITDIVLYSHIGEKIALSIHPGELNIITGESKTGKSALIDIIDFCLGRKSCRIPAGPIRNKVQWVGIRLQLIEGQVFIARKLPVPSSRHSSTIYYDVQTKIEIPDHNELKGTINLSALRALLSKHIQITENIKESTHKKLKADIRHSTNFVFQKQIELFDNRILFHRQSEYQIYSDIKDTLPYFLGAVDTEFVSKSSKLRELRRDLRNLNFRQVEIESIRKEGFSKAKDLLTEAQNLGLYNSDANIEIWDDYISALQEIQIKPINIEKEAQVRDTKFEKLMDEQSILINNINSIRRQINATKKFDSHRQDYSKEVKIHLDRLKSIDLFDEQTKNTSTCPVCNSSILKNELPQFKDFEESIKKLGSQIRSVDEKSPQMQKALRILNERLEAEKQKLKVNYESLKIIKKSDEKLEKIHTYNNQRAYLKGRIDLYLESIIYPKDTIDLTNKIRIIKNEIQNIESELNSKTVENRLKPILDEINDDIRKWAKHLDLEYSDSPIYLDPSRVLLKFDTKDGTILFNDVGSAENGLGYHIVTNYAIHKWFVNKNRPLPRFLFIDQPSQPYFSSDMSINQGEEDTDRKTVKRIYKLTYDFIKQLNPNFQIIITDHAEFREKWFRDCLRKTWRKDNKLVPESWPSYSDI